MLLARMPAPLKPVRRAFSMLTCDERTPDKPNRMETSAFLEFIRLVVAGDTDRVSRRLSATPALATTASPVGATRQQATDFFFTAISHYLYAGDTALHMAAAAFSRPIAEMLMSRGADCRARNRRGAEPLHYAADEAGSKIIARLPPRRVSWSLARREGDPNGNFHFS